VIQQWQKRILQAVLMLVVVAAGARLVWATRTSAKVPSSSENSRRHFLRGSSKSLRSPNSS
jgi:hypothetical protein